MKQCRCYKTAVILFVHGTLACVCLSYGCTWEVAKHSRSKLCSEQTVCSNNVIFLLFHIFLKRLLIGIDQYSAYCLKILQIPCIFIVLDKVCLKQNFNIVNLDDNNNNYRDQSIYYYFIIVLCIVSLNLAFLYHISFLKLCSFVVSRTNKISLRNFFPTDDNYWNK